ncbi:MAG: hypothetical protein HZA79_11210 [Sphingobacteriales bacterium]|nr:hypothetical protein [Sphingobacteriales bacterium]
MGRTLPTGQAGRNNDQDAKTPRCQIMTKIQETRTLPTGQAGRNNDQDAKTARCQRKTKIQFQKREHFDREKDRSKSEKKRAVVRI